MEIQPSLTIGILTSGGDAPGMNACIRAVVRTGMTNNARMLGVYNGFEGLIDGEYHPLGPRDVGGILQRGGTILRTRRSKRFMEKSGQRDAIRKMNEAGMDALIVIGGDGSLRGAQVLHEQGVRVIGIPASIDNDIWGTDIAIGVDTAMNTIMDAVDKLRDTASSHSRAFLVETMGRNCGYLAVMAGIVSGAEDVLIPEVQTTVDEIATSIENAYKRGKNHSIIIIAEGSGFRATELAKSLEDKDVGFRTRVTVLGHIQRGGSPTAYDRLLASRMGFKAVDGLIKGQSGMMTGLKERGIDLIPIPDVVANKRTVNMEYYEMAKVLAR